MRTLACAILWAISLGRREKLFSAIRNNPKDVRFSDARRAAEYLGFELKGVKGSHHSFTRPGEAAHLNFQNRGGKIPAYQANQLIEMIDKYEDEE